MTIEDPSLSSHDYQLLPLATSQYVGDYKKIDVSGIFFGVFLIVGGGELMTIEDLDITECPWLPIVAPSNQLFSRE